MGKKFNLKYSEGLRVCTFQVNQRIDFLEIYLDTGKEEAPVISFAQVKKAQEEIKDFKRFLKFNGFNDDWFEIIRRKDEKELKEEADEN